MPIGAANCNGATTASFTPNDHHLGQHLRLDVSFTDPLGFTEHLQTAPTLALASAVGVETAPFIIPSSELIGLPNTATAMDKPITNMFLPFDQVFNDNEVGTAGITYAAAVVDTAGTAHTITGALGFQGLNYATTKFVGAAGVTHTLGNITGTPTTVAGGAGFAGGITIRITATDPQGLAVTNDFTLDVLGGNNAAPVIAPAVFAASNFDENVDAVAAVGGLTNHNTTIGTKIADLSATDTLTLGEIASGVGAANLAWSINNSELRTQALFKVAAVTNTLSPTSTVSTGRLQFNQTPDFEAIKQQVGNNPDVSINAAGTEIKINVKVQVTDGLLTSTQAETVLIENVNEKSTGSLRISGFTATAANATLSAIDTIADADLINAANPSGLLSLPMAAPNSATAFQWQRWTVGTNSWARPIAVGLSAGSLAVTTNKPGYPSHPSNPVSSPTATETSAHRNIEGASR